MILLVLFILFYATLFWVENFKGKKGKPPGPISIPPFGNLIQISLADKESYLGLHKMAQKYGDVMSIKMGLLDTVIISSYEAFRVIFAKDESTGRDCSGIVFDRNLNQITNGMIFSQGREQIETKKFSRETLRHYGYGNREYMQSLTLDELTEFLTFKFAGSNPNRIMIHFEADFFHPFFLNIICTLVIGKRLRYDDPEFQLLLKRHTDSVKSSALGVGLMAAYPFLRHVFPGALGHDVQMKCIYTFRNTSNKFLSERRQVPYDKNPECFTDSFLQKMDEDAKKPKPLFTEDHFAVLFADLIQAGIDTTSNVINFIILQLTVNLPVQEKVYQEILHVIGSDRLPSLGDKINMPYTQAAIYEGLRWTRVVAMGVPRKALDDIVYNEYVIKKGTVLTWNVHSIFFDKKIWDDPQVFRPERFFNLDGTWDTKRVDMIQATFGAGKRVCFGEALARDSLFLITATLFQKFKFTLPIGAQPDLEPGIGFTSYAKPYDAIVSPR